MNKCNFSKYSNDAEILGGDYWNFLDATSETLAENNIYLGHISEIIQKITNEDLKLKIKNKIFFLIMENGLYYSGLNMNLTYNRK